MKIIYKLVDSNRIFALIIVAFIIGLGVSTVVREGKDLKVGLYGVHQAWHKRSPYDNPLDPPRPLYRYAPGFAILQYPFVLKSEMVEPFTFKHITPSALAWYTVVILSLFASVFLLLKLVPSASFEASIRNLKIGILMTLPLLGYELSNGQNKLLALFFLLCAIFFFERKRSMASAIFLNLALTVYIPLFVFLFYFLLKSRGRYLIAFVLGALLVFIAVPSLAFGFDFNLYLLKDWFIRCLKPFFLTTSYETYIDLRASSQSLPSTLGRLFVEGHTFSFRYHLSPMFIHFAIRFFSFLLTFFSCLVIWRHRDEKPEGLDYAIFLALALILPAYCIYYTWAYLFVFYLAIFNYLGLAYLNDPQKRRLRNLTIALFFSSWLISVHFFNQISLLFWATLLVWMAMVEARWKKISQ